MSRTYPYSIEIPVVDEFIHPETGRRRAWFDALSDEGAREP